jgi:hypothetical protein
MYGVFINALSPNRHNPGAKMPCSNFWNRDIPSNARQSEVEPGYKMDRLSSVLPRASHTDWQSNPNFFFLQQKYLPGLHPASLQSFGDGLCNQIRIPSIAPAQHSKSAVDTFAKPWAIDCCLSWSSGYDIQNLACLLMALTTYQQLLNVSV